MIDIQLFRENPKIIRESEKKRFKDPVAVDKVIELDIAWRKIRAEINDIRRRRNELSKLIGQKKKQGLDASEEFKEAEQVNSQIKENEAKSDQFLADRDRIRYSIGNILHDSVPLAEDEEGNEIVRTWGEHPKFSFPPQHHADLVVSLEGAELIKAAEVAGSRTYYLKKDLVFLNLALIRLGLDVLSEKGYTPFWTPFFLSADVMRGASELADLEKQLYKVESDNLFLIATSEQSLASLHWGEVLNPEDLPLRYAGVSTCFRREAGTHGKDTKGIFRVHQFEKVEQFIFCKPEESWDMHEELISNAEEIFRTLEIPYQVTNIASGEMNDNAAKKYDIEAWFPTQERYREVVSCSNCTDYQARKMKIRLGKYGGEKEFIHTLNSTAIATERTICAILENFQQEDGSVELPEKLWPYMSGQKRIEARASK
ncbi:MAG: serine--tRNA ligase [Candidatus Heimdallarchaeota archaeon]